MPPGDLAYLMRGVGLDFQLEDMNGLYGTSGWRRELFLERR